jgi:hypothetical protein
MTNPWLEYVKKVQEENPTLKYPEVLKLAKLSYVKIDNQQEKKEDKPLSMLSSGATKQGGINSQDDTKLQFPERSASLPADNHPAEINSQETKLAANTTNSSPDSLTKTHNPGELKRVYYQNVSPQDANLKKSPEEKIKSHLENYGRTVIPIREKEDLEKSKSQLSFWKVFAILSFILLLIFVFLVYDDRFKSTFYTEVTPNITAYTNSTAQVTANVNNDYNNAFNPNTTVQNIYYNNYTIINNIVNGS